jgi:hypothetical protein
MRALSGVAAGAVLSAVLILLAGGGCEAIVGDSLGGEIACVEAPGACPSGQACVGGVCKAACTGPKCESPEGGTDATIDRTAPQDGPADTSHHEAEAGLLPLGAACPSSAACASGLCGTTALLINVATPEMASVCTKSCCTSADCDDPDSPGLVCHPSVGGDYCVEPGWVKLVEAGAAPAGSDCTEASDCRSSVCTKSKCQDTCCTSADCDGGGTVCQASFLEGETTFNCGPSGGTVAAGGNCNSKACADNACLQGIPNYCVGPCCNDTQCGTAGANGATICNWNLLKEESDGGNLALRGCSVALHPGGAEMGGACTAAKGCKTGLCYSDTVCTSPCCADTDCPKGWTCGFGSFPVTLSNVDLQVCVPPPGSDP